MDIKNKLQKRFNKLLVCIENGDDIDFKEELEVLIKGLKKVRFQKSLFDSLNDECGVTILEDEEDDIERYPIENLGIQEFVDVRDKAQTALVTHLAKVPDIYNEKYGLDDFLEYHKQLEAIFIKKHLED